MGPLSFQPSELAKLGLVLFISGYAAHRQAKVRNFFTGFVPLVGVLGIVTVLIVKEDFGTTVLIAAVCFILLMMAGCRWWHLGLLLPPAAVAAYFLLWHSDFRRTRLLAFLHPEQYAKTIGYHPLQSLLTIMSGGFWGRGLGNGIQKMGYLPEDNTDFIFAVICEELGFFGALMVVVLFVAFVIVGWRIAARCNHLFGKMVAFGITGIIGLQAAINVAVVTVSMPTKGIALPLISSGGTGWIMMAAAGGVLMSIERINRSEAADDCGGIAHGSVLRLSGGGSPRRDLPAARSGGGRSGVTAVIWPHRASPLEKGSGVWFQAAAQWPKCLR